jgi:hypothetical protein
VWAKGGVQREREKEKERWKERGVRTILKTMGRQMQTMERSHQVIPPFTRDPLVRATLGPLVSILLTGTMLWTLIKMICTAQLSYPMFRANSVSTP